jgi:hypothetical protein
LCQHRLVQLTKPASTLGLLCRHRLVQLTKPASTLGLLCRHRLVQLTKPASTLGLLCPLVAPTFWRPQSTPLLPRTRPSALRHQVVKSWQLSIAAPPSTFFSVDLQALKRHTLPSPALPEIPLAPLTVAIY